MFPDPEQRPVQRLPYRIVALAHGDADTFAEVAVVDVGPAAKAAAILRIRAVEPEGERDGVPEQQVDLALAQRRSRGLGAGIGAQLRLGEQGLQIGLMRGAGHHRDFLAFEPLRQRIVYRRIPPRHEAGGRAVVGVGEIELRPHLRGRRDRSDRRVALVAVERGDERLEPTHLHGALELELVAHHAREVDVEALWIAVGSGEVERRIIDLGEETDHAHPRQVRPLRPPARVPEPGYANTGLGCRQLRGCRRSPEQGSGAEQDEKQPCDKPGAAGYRHGSPGLCESEIFAQVRGGGIRRALEAER